MLDNALGNQNIVLGRQENFLWRFEVEFHSLNFSKPDFVVAMGSEKPLWESAKQLQVAASGSRRNFPDVLEQCSGYLKNYLMPGGLNQKTALAQNISIETYWEHFFAVGM